MPLSLNGLQEGDFTALRVLKNGVLQDVLSLTASGSADIPSNSLTIAQMAGLQSQLNAKATTAALTAAAESLGSEIDVLDVSVGAVATAVAGLSTVVGLKAAASALEATNALVETKASLVTVSAINTSLSNQLNVVSQSLGSKASTTALTTGLAGKQDLLAESVTLGALTVSGGEVALLQHNLGLAIQNDSGQTYAVFEPAGATLGSLIVQGDLTASNTYNKSQVDQLMDSKASTGAVDASLALKQSLIEENLTMAGGLFRLSTTGGSFSIQRLIDGVYISVLILQYNAATAATRMICSAEFRPTTIGGLQELSVQNRLTAGEVIAGNLYSRTQVDELFGTWSYRIPDGSLAKEKVLGLVAALADKVNRSELQNGLTDLTLANVIASTLIVDSNSTSVTCNLGNDAGYLTIRDGNQLDSYAQRSQTPSALYLCRNSLYPVQCGNSLYVGDISFSADAATHQLAVAGSAIIREGLTASSVSTEFLTVTTPSTSSAATTTCEIGSGFSFLRFTHGHHLDCFSRGSNSGRVMYLNYYANSGVRITKLGINTDPAGDVHLDVKGNARFSGTVTASNFPSSSDARLKTEVEPLSVEECTRLVKAVTPCTYKRIDMEGNPARIGYLAQSWDGELRNGYRSIMGESEDENGKLLTIDYSRVTVLLHGALLSALARIEALESRL